MKKLSAHQKNEIKKLLPLNEAIDYDESHIEEIFSRLEIVLSNSYRSPEMKKITSRNDRIKDQKAVIENIQKNLEKIQQGIRILTPNNKNNLDDAFSYTIFSDIKETREKLTGNTEIVLEWHLLDMEHIFKILTDRARELKDHINEHKNSNDIFYQHLCNFWESERLSHTDIKLTDNGKFVQLAAILLNKSNDAANKEIQRLNLNDEIDSHIYLD
jgi:ribosomal protein S15P/S13E